MGTYLSKPVTEKEYKKGNNEFLSFVSCSMQGWRSAQEDSHNCIIDFDENISLFGVYDGHGGKEIAQLCSNELPNVIKNCKYFLDCNYDDALKESFLSFDESILTSKIQNVLLKIDNNISNDNETKQLGSSTPGFYSGSTAIVSLIDRKKMKIHVANVGDSRCVLCRNGRAVDLSTDHKPANRKERKRIIHAGGVLGADGRINGGLNLTRSIGDHSYKRNRNVDLKDQIISALPDVMTIDLKPEIDEFMVLACDGIWDTFSSIELIEFIKRRLMTIKMEDLIAQIFNHCLAPNTDSGSAGCDNMTCVIVTFTGDDGAGVCHGATAVAAAV